MSRYFDELDFLYENLRLLEADRQLEIAETGADVNEQGLDSDQAQGQEQPPEQPMDGGQDMDNAAQDDASYMNDDQPQDDNVPIDEVSRNKKLFDLFNELLTYSKYFQENIRNLATDMLDSESLKNIIKLKFDLNNTVKKINDYMLGQFPKYPYERSLYVYITLRTEIMTEVKLIRDLLLRDNEKN